MNIKTILQFLGWEILNPIVLKIKENKLYNFSDRYMGINLGCGVVNPKNWLGIDGGVYLLFRSIPEVITKKIWHLFNMSTVYTFESYLGNLYSMDIIHHDLIKGIPFEDNTIPAIYSSHFLEHLTRKDAVKLLSECFRVLEPKGIVRFCIPSLDDEVNRIEKAIIAYKNGDINEIQLYVTSKTVVFRNRFSNHKFMYNFSEMESLLSGIGFINISDRSFGVGEIPDVENLDKRNGLFVEAIKP